MRVGRRVVANESETWLYVKGILQLRRNSLLHTSKRLSWLCMPLLLLHASSSAAEVSLLASPVPFDQSIRPTEISLTELRKSFEMAVARRNASIALLVASGVILSVGAGLIVGAFRSRDELKGLPVSRYHERDQLFLQTRALALSADIVSGLGVVIAALGVVLF